mmetsp:Transcript_33922/g.96097  ORF Transcript_33922/g.96097 Transcript_33922/m.96097 type:complete len:216 (-) Transcript_33922:1868-2515(-)
MRRKFPRKRRTSSWWGEEGSFAPGCRVASMAHDRSWADTKSPKPGERATSSKAELPSHKRMVAAASTAATTQMVMMTPTLVCGMANTRSRRRSSWKRSRTALMSFSVANHCLGGGAGSLALMELSASRLQERKPALRRAQQATNPSWPRSHRAQTISTQAMITIQELGGIWFRKLSATKAQARRTGMKKGQARSFACRRRTCRGEVPQCRLLRRT